VYTDGEPGIHNGNFGSYVNDTLSLLISLLSMREATMRAGLYSIVSSCLAERGLRAGARNEIAR
jgi:hypothetical protein